MQVLSSESRRCLEAMTSDNTLSAGEVAALGTASKTTLTAGNEELNAPSQQFIESTITPINT